MMDVLARITAGRAIMIGLVLAAFYYFAMYDDGTLQQQQIETAKAKYDDFNRQFADAEKKLYNAQVYKKTAAEVGGTITKFLSLIPANFRMYDLKSIVSNEAKVAGSSLVGITDKTTQVSSLAEEFEEVGLSIELQGSFLQHMVFLSNLTKVNQILIIRKFEMLHAREGKGDEAPLVTLTAEIYAYRYRGKTAAADASGTPGAGGTGQ